MLEEDTDCLLGQRSQDKFAWEGLEFPIFKIWGGP